MNFDTIKTGAKPMTRRAVSRAFLGLAAALGGALGFSGCGRSVTSRFKLTLTLDTPSGVRSGSSVVEFNIREVRIPDHGFPRWLRGEAVYVDLGPGRRPLIALLTNSDVGRPGEGPKYWAGGEGPRIDYLMTLYGEKHGKDGVLDIVARLARHRGVRDIPTAALPDLVTFAEVNDPKSVLKVDPENLEATLGAGVKWKRVTLEMTDEPVTRGIEKRLPWLDHLEKYRTDPQNPFSNTLPREIAGLRSNTK